MRLSKVRSRYINLFVLFTSTICFASSASAQSWTHLFPTGGRPVVRTRGPGVYDPASNRMIVFGGRDADGKNLNDVWVLVNANGLVGASQWMNLIPNGASGSPPARSGHSTVYDAANNRLIIFGGCGGYCVPVLNDVWVLTNANGLGGTPVWSQVSIVGNGPPARTSAAASYDASGSYLIIVGGQDGSADPCSTFSDIWTLSIPNSPGEPTGWTQRSASGPPGLDGAAAAYSPDGSTITLFGGMRLLNGTCQATNEVWSIVVIPEAIALGNVVLNGAVGSPPARSFAAAVYDATGQRLLVFGGLDASGAYLNDVWALSNSASHWSSINPKDAPPPARNGQAAIFDAVHQRMTIFGGTDASGVLNDTWVLHAPGIPEFGCIATSGVPNIVRAEGITEQVGDVVLNCTGGKPTPQGVPIPEYTLTYTLNTNITSRRLPEAPDLSAALLFIDEPAPAMPIPSYVQPQPFQPPQILCKNVGSNCGETGTGGTPNPYATQPNVFVGKQVGPATVSWKVPIDPPGGGSVRVIRMTNVRGNASLLSISSGLIPTQVNAMVESPGTPSLPVAGAQQLVVGQSIQGAPASVFSSASLPRCKPHNAVLLGGSGTAAFDLSVQVQEGFSYAFKNRNYGTTLDGPVFPGPLVEQNVPGFVYDTETAFYSPSLFTPAPTLGLADFGTRIHVSFGPISAGTHLFVPTTITLGGEYGEGTLQGQLQLVQANDNGKSAPGYQPVVSTAMIGSTPVAKASVTGSTAYATYEVTYADPSVQETATIPVAVAFTTKPALGPVMASTTLAPLDTIGSADETSSIPRFANFATPETAYSIESCTTP